MEILIFSIVHKRKNYGFFSLVFHVEKLILTAHQKRGVFFHFPQEIENQVAFQNLQWILDLGKLHSYDVISFSSEGKFGFKNIT